MLADTALRQDALHSCMNIKDWLLDPVLTSSAQGILRSENVLNLVGSAGTQ